MLKKFFLGLALFSAGCGATISTVNSLAENEGGVPYTLPTGLVPIIVFADQNGVGITVEPASMAVDGQVGTLVAKFQPSPFNNENIKVATNADTGFLSTSTSDSKAQLIAVAAEAAAAAERLSFQNAQASFLKQRVVVLQDAFDPLNPSDIDRVNKGIAHALRHAARAFAQASNSQMLQGPVKLRVSLPDGSNPFVSQKAAHRTKPDPSICSIGICARTMTSRLIRIEHDGVAFGSKLVNIPSKELIPVPVSSRLLANNKTTITVQNGVLTGAQVVRDSEALGLIKIPGQILGGLVTGFTQAVDDEKALSNKEIEQIQIQQKLEAARVDSVKLQNSPELQSGSLYLSKTLTVYPFSNALQSAISANIAAAEAREAAQLKAIENGLTTKTLPKNGGDLTNPVKEDENGEQ